MSFYKSRCWVKDKNLLGVELNPYGSQAEICQSKLGCKAAGKQYLKNDGGWDGQEEVTVVESRCDVGLVLAVPTWHQSSTVWSHSNIRLTTGITSQAGLIEHKGTANGLTKLVLLVYQPSINSHKAWYSINQIIYIKFNRVALQFNSVAIQFNHVALQFNYIVSP